MLASLPDWLFYGLPALLYLSLTAWAIAQVLGSAAGRQQKALWMALLLLFPLLGLFNWMIMGPRRARGADT
ncbi:PLDc N-terminal domain-containing protein [Pseudomonas sp. ML96]|uniref:PLDc N-terminal domain-containing protein n=1 Tax=Pseudomonas sp. ML96 TaxID=1523503 RepID=UPI0005B9BF8A|nr:PLDc N-terminal domain-containing protein [Pseudomonas sp. ML96]